MSRSFAVLLGALVAFSGFSAQAAEWGTLKGRFVYDGKAPSPTPITPNKDVQVCAAHPLVEEDLVVGADGGLANVVVFLRSKPSAIHSDYDEEASKEVVMDNENCRFSPHVAAMWTKQTLVLKNSDPVGHNSKLDAFANAAINPLIPANGEVKQTFAAAENIPVKVSCNIHPWMQGYLVVRPDPYFAVSEKDGTFEIKNLPAGEELEFTIWQEKSGYLKEATVGGKPTTWKRGRMTMTVKAGETTDLGDIKVSPKLFQK